MNPSLIVCRKLTIASSSASGRPSRPTRFVFMLAVDSGAGQHVLPRLGHWVGNAAGRRGIVEMHDRLQAFEISVVPVGLHEVRRGPLIHIAQRRHLKSRLIVWRQRAPVRIYRRRLAERVPLGEKGTDTAVDE